MRKTAVVLVLTLLAALGATVPSVAASSEPKVVIIVGATHGVTSTYRAYADQAYAEAIKYTSNVVKVYSPNATWARVKAAVSGASVVIYMGHGNGWPSPYSFDPAYRTKDGFGLNATEGAGDSNNVYYGEPYVSTLNLAPGAVILLHHLCYAAGNSEPGNPEPSVSVARQRVDNYAAGFLKAGAAAVIADGHAGPEGYLRALFTTQQPIESLWAGQEQGNGNIVSFPSVRTPGATAFQDPQTPTSGFYRSLVVRTSGVTPGDLGNGGGTPIGAPLITASSLSSAAFSPNGDGHVDATTMRLTVSGLTGYGWRVEPLIDGTAAPAIVEGAADGTAAEFTWSGQGADGALAPDGTYLMTVWAGNGPDDRSQVQKVVTVDTQPPALSATTTPLSIRPNLDGRFAATSLGLTANETVTGRARVFDATGLTVRTWKFNNTTVGAWAWDGTDATGSFVSDGTYSFRVDGVDAAGNGTVQQTPVLVDRTIGNITWASTSFRPALGQADRLSLKLLRPATVSVSIYQGKTLVRRVWIDKTQDVGNWSWSWNGRNGHGELVAPGVYTASVTATGSVGVSRLTRTVTVRAP